MDEMSIREHVHWDGSRFYGYTDIGIDESSIPDNSMLARNALVYMAVSLNNKWKIPLGYFLITGLNAEQRGNLLKKCLTMLHGTGAICNSITFDGAAVNVSMCTTLRCNFTYSNQLKPWFEHPITKEKVFVFFDACHMLKLIRNAFGTKKVFLDGDGNYVQWSHIQQLHELQEQEGLRAGNKLTKRHLNWEQEKMNVRLAAQLLSNSVADFLTYCEMKFDRFSGANATSKFCKIINMCFDLLNARNVFSKSKFCQKISDKNIDVIIDNANYCVNYIANLKLVSGKPIIESQRKIGFLGMIICLKNMTALYTSIHNKTNQFKYLLTYKLSQDHLEVSFSAIRSCGGHNNNPSAYQFRNAYRRLLVRHQISGSKHGNCVDFEDTEILNVGSANIKKITRLHFGY